MILTTLLIASVALPLLLRNFSLPGDDHHRADLRLGRIAAARAALSAIDGVRDEMAASNPGPGRLEAVAAALSAPYRQRVVVRSERSSGDANHAAKAAERRMRKAALDAERSAILSLKQGDEIDETVAVQLLHELDLADVHYSSVSDGAPCESD